MLILEDTVSLIHIVFLQIQIYNTLEGFTKTYTADFGNGDIIGLGKYKRRLIAGLSSGVVQVWSKKDNFLINTGAKLDKVRVFDVNSDIFATGMYFFFNIKKDRGNKVLRHSIPH